MQSTTDPAVDVTELVKRYPTRPTNAVDGLSFSVGRGEVLGHLGQAHLGYGSYRRDRRGR